MFRKLSFAELVTSGVNRVNAREAKRQALKERTEREVAEATQLLQQEAESLWRNVLGDRLVELTNTDNGCRVKINLEPDGEMFELAFKVFKRPAPHVSRWDVVWTDDNGKRRRSLMPDTVEGTVSWEWLRAMKWKDLGFLEVKSYKIGGREMGKRFGRCWAVVTIEI